MLQPTQAREIMTLDEIENEIRETPLLERLNRCVDMVGQMCAELRPPLMSIPVRATDEDEYIITTLKDAAQKIDALQQENAILRTRIAELEDDCNEYAELLSEEYDTWAKQFTLPYPDNPLTKERREKSK